jgi:zinc protease
VTREQIRKVAQRIFNPDHRTAGVLVPTETAQAPAAQEAGR